MSHKKKRKKSGNIKSSSIIHSRRYSTPEISHNHNHQYKRQCIYYDGVNNKCTNKGCSKVYCQTARGCPCYNTKSSTIVQNTKTDDLSAYDENYIAIPNQAGTHERTNEYITVSKTVGTQMHVGYLHSGEHKRRHIARCIYFDRSRHYCTEKGIECRNSRYCTLYTEKE